MQKVIYLISPNSIFGTGGAEEFFRGLFERLNKKYRYLYLFQTFKLYKIKITESKLNYYLKYRKYKNIFSYFRTHRKFYIKLNFSLLYLLIRNRVKLPDIIYISSPTVLFSILLPLPIFILKRTKIIIGNHSFYLIKSDSACTTTFSQRAIIYIFSLLQKLGLVKKDKIKVHTLNTLQEIFYKFSEYKNVYILYNYIYTQKLIPIEDNNEFIVTFIGRFDYKQKGLDILYEIINKTLEKNNKIKFYIAGGGNKKWEDKFKELENKYPHNVKYLGVISEEEKYELLSKSSIFISPSRYETGVPTLAVGEALGEGNVVLLSNIISFYDLLKIDRKFGFICKDTNDYVDKILELHNLWKNNRREYLKLREYIRNKAIEEFDYDKIMDKIEEKLFN